MLDCVSVVVHCNIIYHSLDFSQLAFHVFYFICAWLYFFLRNK